MSSQVARIRSLPPSPVLRLNGDAIEIGISPGENGGWRLSDLGETHSMFFLADLDFHEDYVRAEEFNQIVISHQLSSAEEEISIEVSDEELPDRIFDFLQRPSIDVWTSIHRQTAKGAARLQHNCRHVFCRTPRIN
jgi:hypothetical protein